MNVQHRMNRRMALRQVAAGGLALGLTGAFPRGSGAADVPETKALRELLVDPSFQRGFRLCEPAPGKRVPYGELRGFENTPPAWDLDQWSSRFKLDPDPAPGPGDAAKVPATNASVRRWGNQGKTVVLRRRSAAGAGAGAGAGVDEADVELEVLASVEYGNRARKADEPWVHLLLEQAIDGAPSLAELGRARFRAEARLVGSKLHRTDDYSPSRHAAQFQVFLALQNTNPSSPGKGRLLWFGIPLYDDRHRVPPEHKTRDTGGTDMFIFTPRGDVYTARSAHDGGWISVDHDVAPLLREGLSEAWSKGFLVESRNLADYRVSSINLGWEVPGLFDVTMKLRGLSLTVSER